jgi:hypothetical protein
MKDISTLVFNQIVSLLPELGATPEHLGLDRLLDLVGLGDRFS